MMDGIGRAAATAKPAVQGTWLLEAYVGALAGPAAAAALTEARIPDMAADNLRLRFGDDGEPAGAAFAHPRVAVIVGDGAAGHPGVTVVPDRAALWGWFRRRLVEHVAPLVEALRPLTSRGAGALWSSVGDSCAGSLDWLGEELGLVETARLDIELLLGVERPLHHRPTYQEVRCSRGADVVRVRRGCCLSYRREEQNGRRPRLSSDERARRLDARAVLVDTASG
jgi:ferric iron reductase protein FhuF